MSSLCSNKSHILLGVFIFLTLSSFAQVCTTCDPTFTVNNGLLACYPFSGSANDASGNVRNGTPNGLAYATDRFSKINQAGSFNGTSNSEITYTAFQVNEFTYSFWVNVTTMPTSGNYYSAISIGNTTTDQAVLLGNNSSLGHVGFGTAFWNTDATGVPAYYTGSLPTPNRWYHIAATRSSSQQRFYVDGVLVSTISTSGKQPGYGLSNYAAFIGKRTGAITQNFNGKIDDVKIFNRALTPSEIASLYNFDLAGFTVDAGSDKTICMGDSVQLTATGGSSYTWTPANTLSNASIANPYAKPSVTTKYFVTNTIGSCSVADSVTVTVNTNCCLNCSSSSPLNNGLVACYPFNNNANDASGNGNHATASNITYTADRFGNPLRAGIFNGSSSTFSFSAATMQSNSYTYSVWVKLAVYPTTGNGQSLISIGDITGDQIIIICKDCPSFGGPSISSGIMGSSYFASATPPSVIVTSGFNDVTNWHHVVLTRDTASMSIKLYLDGLYTGSQSIPTTTAFYGLANGQIGSRIGSVSQTVNGRLDDVRIYNRALSANEVIQLYNLANDGILVDAGSDKSICLKDSIQFQATGATAYAWTPTSSLSNASIFNPYAKPTTTTKYFVTGTTGTCSSTDSITVTVNTATVDAGNNIQICKGDSIQLNASGTTSYSWTPVGTLSNALIINPYAKPTTTTKYFVTGTTGSCSTKDSVTITVNTVNLNLTAGKNPICKGDSTRITASGATSYAWNTSTTISDTSIANPYVKPSTTAKYIVTATSSGCTKKDSITITVNSVSVDAGLNQTICRGDSVQLTASGASSYAWSSNSTLSAINIANPKAKPINTTQFFVTGNSGTCTAKDSVTITVDSVPLKINPVGHICKGDSVSIVASGATTYQWATSTTLSDTIISNPYAKPNISTKYFVTATYGLCKTKDSITVTVDTMTADAGLNMQICSGDSVQLHATGGTSYKWRYNLSLSDTLIFNPYAKPVTNTTYYLTAYRGLCSATDSVNISIGSSLNVDAGISKTICLGDSIQLRATGASIYRWLSKQTLSDSTIANPYAKPVIQTKYFVTGTLGSCSATDSVTISVTTVLVDAGNNQTICKHDSIQLSAFGASSYLWNNSPTLSSNIINNPYAKPLSTATYFVTGTTGSCSAIDSVTITVNSVPLSAGLNGQICAGDSIQLSASGGSSYLWTPSTGLSSTNIFNPKASPASTTTYIVRGDLLGCVEHDTITVTVAPNPTINMGVDTLKCIYDAYTFSPTVTGANTYLWSPPNLLDNNAILNPTTQTTTPQYFILKATNSTTGCSHTDSIFVNIRNPKALFDVSDSVSVVPPLSVVFTNKSIPLPLSYNWFIGDTITRFDFSINPAPHTFNYSGKYPITLVVRDDNGCVDSLTRYITINELMNVFIPNVFTPNSDGTNDVFQIRYNAAQSKILLGTIWNRWGTKIYDFTVPNDNWWDGKADGVPASDGVYFYIVSIEDLKGTITTYHGTITLLR